LRDDGAGTSELEKIIRLTTGNQAEQEARGMFILIMLAS